MMTVPSRSHLSLHAAEDAELAEENGGAAGLDTSKPSVARVYDVLLGGKNNFAADREHADELLGIYPDLWRLARENRRFLRRSVHWLAAERGVRQFLDVGTGLPAMPSIHEIALAADPACRVVYVDNDAQVVLHADALLADGRNVVAVGGDATDPASILADLRVSRLIQPAEPCAVILALVLHFTDLGTASRIVAEFTEMIAPGSYLVISVGSGDTRIGGTLARAYQPTTLYNHSQDQVRTLFAGLEIADPPGLADARLWAPGIQVPSPSRSGAHILAAVARKPQLTAVYRAQREGRAPTSRNPPGLSLHPAWRCPSYGVPTAAP